MREVHLKPEFEAWQKAARRLAQQDVPPEEVMWLEDSGDPLSPRQLEAGSMEERGETATSFTVPRRFMIAAQKAARHQDPGRWALLYRILWRLLHENRRLLEIAKDPDVKQLFEMERHAGRHVETLRALSIAPSVADIASSARPFVPREADLAALGEAAKSCTGCELYKRATQVVFGRGASKAGLMLIGEQPGDQEDLQGAPFVGPAGEVLDRALAEAGIARHEIYVTNVVKHFKWEARGKRRIHQTPRQLEIDACRPWLEAEMRAVQPEIIVCLGSTALQALIGPGIRVLKSRGKVFQTAWAPALIATLHPSAILRIDDPSAAEASYQMLVEDLRKAVAGLRKNQTMNRGTTDH